jgi:hypothetical protein
VHDAVLPADVLRRYAASSFALVHPESPTPRKPPPSRHETSDRQLSILDRVIDEVGASSQPTRTRSLTVAVFWPSGAVSPFDSFDEAELELERMYPDVIFDELAAGDGLVAMSSRGTVDGQARPVAWVHPPAGTQLAGVGAARSPKGAPLRWSTQAPPPGKQIPAGWRWQPRAVSPQSGQFCSVCRAGTLQGGGMFLEDDRFYLEADTSIQSCGSPAHARQIYSPGTHGVGAMTEAARAKQRRANQRDRGVMQRQNARSELELLRQGVKAARELKRTKVAAIRARCKALSAKARELRIEAAECRATARGVAAARSVDVKHARELVHDAARLQKSVKRYSKPATLKGSSKAPGRSPAKLAAERRQHTYDEVEQSLPAELVPAWLKVRHRIKETPRMTLLEAFLSWAHDHPAQVYEYTQEQDEKALRALERQEREHYAAHKPSRRARAEHAPVPF